MRIFKIEDQIEDQIDAHLAAALASGDDAGSARSLPLLTTRETECLRWTAEGKTAWEVGRILQISERTANWHLQAASRKLGCTNKIQAVVKAIRIGLLH